MRIDRLHRLANHLAALSDDQFTTDVWVKAAAADQRTPQVEACCPVGWLPRVEPTAWCWVAIPDTLHQDKPELYPVCKESEVWAGTGHLPQRDADTLIVMSVWRQCQEWFELTHEECDALLYTGGRAEVVERLMALTQ